MFMFLDQRNQSKMQWLEDSIHRNVNNLNNVIREARSHFWKSRKEYLKSEFNELETSSKNKIIRNLYIAASVSLIRVTRHGNNIMKVRRLICLQAHIIFWI
jgi:hypothetical protein